MWMWKLVLNKQALNSSKSKLLDPAHTSSPMRCPLPIPAPNFHQIFPPCRWGQKVWNPECHFCSHPTNPHPRYLTLRGAALAWILPEKLLLLESLDKGLGWREQPPVFHSVLLMTLWTRDCCSSSIYHRYQCFIPTFFASGSGEGHSRRGTQQQNSFHTKGGSKVFLEYILRK